MRKTADKRAYKYNESVCACNDSRFSLFACSNLCSVSGRVNRGLSKSPVGCAFPVSHIRFKTVGGQLLGSLTSCHHYHHFI